MKVLVIGDSCVDNFIYCDINRICPEAPVPVLQPIESTTNPGMASNVARNLISLGAEVELITNEINIRKTRYIDIKSGQMIMRLDENDNCDEFEGEYDSSGYDAVIISDYNKGFLKEEDIFLWLNSCNVPTFLDTKKRLGKFSSIADFVKINKPEMESNKDYSYDNIIVTDGKNGAMYKNKIYPVSKQVKVSNVSGAGDTFLAGLVYSFIKEGRIDKAIRFANDCAIQVVQQRGVTVCQKV